MVAQVVGTLARIEGFVCDFRIEQAEHEIACRKPARLEAVEHVPVDGTQRQQWKCRNEHRFTAVPGDPCVHEHARRGEILASERAGNGPVEAQAGARGRNSLQ